MAAARFDAAGTILIGNSRGSAREVSLSLGRRGGEPTSSPGALDAMAKLFHSLPSRPARPFGGIERMSCEADYLNTLRPHFHALRPLRLVIDTTSQVLLRYLETLTSTVAVTIERAAIGSFDLARLGERVRTSKAHLGLWIDGDAEACRAVDEHGETIPVDSLAALVIRVALKDSPDASTFTDGDRHNRESIRNDMIESGAAFAADHHGRIWFGDCPSSDALEALTLLVTLLSRDDRPLSERAASAIL
jgi:phosphomannomutase